VKEFIPYLCWLDFDKDIPEHMQLWRTLNIKGIRGFFNIDHIPHIPSLPTQSFIQHCFDTMPNPMKSWTYEDNPLPWLQKGMIRDLFDICKQEKWLPIISFGCQEELPHGWLGRAIAEDKWDWLVEFVRQLGIYLRDTMKFDRVDFEWWNEPTKLQGLGFGWDKYCKLGNKLAIAWHSVSKNYKFYAFSDDTLALTFLNDILTDKVFMQNVDVISTHCGVAREDDEFEMGMIKYINTLIAKYPHLKQSVSEFTCNGIISRLNQLIGTTIGYGHIGLNRHLIGGNLLGTRMDDYAIWDTDLFKITASDKIKISAKFNKDNYKAYTVVEDDIMLEEIYENGSRSIGVTFIQKVLNEDIDIDLDPKLKVDGWFGDKTENAVKLYQKNFNLEVDGRVGEITFKSMIFNNQNLFDELMYDIHR
jgi:hypothetical protein